MSDVASTDLTIFGISRLDEPALRRAAKSARDAMWKTPLLTKKRADLEKKTNQLAAAADQALKVHKSKLFKGVPEKLWNTPNKARLVNFAGFFSSLTGIPSDAILAVAGGNQAGPPLLEAEYRTTILGAILALNASGAANINAKNLKAPLVGSKAGNDALAAACGMPGKDLATVYAAMVKRVSAYGPAMRSLAWCLRTKLWLAHVAKAEAVHATAAGVVALIPLGVTQLVGLAISSHSAITLALCKAISLKADQTIQQVLPKAKKEAAAKAKKAPAAGGGAMARSRGGAGTASSPLAAFSALPMPVKIGLGVGVIGLGVVAIRRFA